MADNRSQLPVPGGLTATQKAKVADDKLPIGGAPPVDIPPFESMLPNRAIPRSVEEQQLPGQAQRPPREGAEIKKDWETAASLFTKGQFTNPQNTPDQAAGLPNVAAHAQQPVGQHPAHDPASIPAQGMPQAPPAVAQPEPPIPAQPAPEDDTDGPTLGDFRKHEAPLRSYSMAMQREANFDREDMRKAVEGRLDDVAVENMILYESVSQLHPIIPGKLEVVFRSLTPEEDLFIKDELYNITSSDRYVMDMMVLMNLACGLQTFNSVAMPSHLKEKAGERTVDKDLFDKKMKIILKIPIQVVALLSVVYGWFDPRVRVVGGE